MIWKRDGSVSVDLRRPRKIPRRSQAIAGWLYVLGFGLTCSAAFAALVLQILLAVQPRELPLMIGGVRSEWLKDAQADSAGWRIKPVARTARYPLAGERILFVEGVWVGSDSFEGSTLYQLFVSLWGRTTATFTIEAGGEQVRRAISTTRPSLGQTLTRLTWRLVPLTVLLLGLLAVRARSEEPAARRFVFLCLLFGLWPLWVLSRLWIQWVNPFFWPFWQSWIVPLGDPHHLRGYLQVLFVLLIFGMFARFLHFFPTYDPVLARKIRVPRITTLVAVVVAVLAVKIARLPVFDIDLARWIDLALWIVPIIPVIGFMFLLIAIQVLRLAAARLRGEDTEELQQAKLGLLGTEIGGALLISALLVLMLGPVSEFEEPLFALILAGAILSPFVGIFFAILRRGLWNVDLFIRRTTVYSALTALFVTTFLFLEVTVENLLPGSLLGIGWLDEVGVAALATGLVAMSHRLVSREITHRFFPDSIKFGLAIEEVSEDMTAMESGSCAAAYLGERLTKALDANPCEVLERLGENVFRKVWSTGATTPTSLVAGAACGALTTSHSVIMLTDEGPVLAARIGKGESYSGMLLLGPRRGGRFYTAEERHLLTPLLNQAAALLRQSG